MIQIHHLFISFFKFTIEFVELILGSTNFMVNLKLGCMEIIEDEYERVML
jgi:hypothetical protein